MNAWQTPRRAGVEAGAELLNANASSFSFLVLVTDGEHNAFGGDPVETAEEIRADNTTTIFAVGVGVCVRERADVSNLLRKIYDLFFYLVFEQL